MAVGVVTGRTRPTKTKKLEQSQKRKRDDVDADKLEAAVAELDTSAKYTSFTDLPLSEPTKAGLKAAHFTILTDIQAKAVPLAIKGYDILGAARTGSGKTLAFLVPVLENLYRAQCVGPDAGLGAMIISPTRELAIQIFEVLRNIGKKGHMFAAGLVIGGKSLREERDALIRMNILVCTPGRILQHLSQTAAFNVDNLRMLVLDEADRILDMGFQKDLDAIIEYLPSQRQTLLFSATQTKKVSDLARLSLRNPEYVAVHEAASTATPKKLQQNYILTPLPSKIDTLWSFLQSSKKSKILVFLSSGKQVRFIYETFRQMQPGIPLLHLHGRQKQTARLDITEKFSRAQHSCLFATDVVARGLDFPAVDWVVQVDCPEDADTYIHRVGRTARYEREGRAVLFLDPSEEEGMLKRLEQKKVPIEIINVRSKKQQSIKSQMQHMCMLEAPVKYLGQKAFASYVRSLHVQKDKEIFKLDKYDLEGYAGSLGLPGAPRIKFLKADAEEVKRRKNAPRQAISDIDESEDDNMEGAEQGKAKKGVRTKYDRMFERQNQDVFADHYSRMIKDDSDAEAQGLDDEQDDDDDLLGVKSRMPVESSDDESDAGGRANPTETIDGKKVIQIPGAKDALILDSKRREKMLKSKKKLLKIKDKGTKVVFDDDGNAHQMNELDDESDFRAKGTAEEQREQFVAKEAQRVQTADVADKELVKEKRRAKKEKRREREQMEMDADEDERDDDRDEDAFANFIADAQSSSDDNDDGDERRSSDTEDDIQPPKRQKKWFENYKAAERTREAKEIETFDELEAAAAKLLG